MGTKHYLRKFGDTFGFVTNDVHDILHTDIPITAAEYDAFFETQSEGKLFRLKATPTGEGLFGYIEEYTPEAHPVSPGLQEHMLDLEFRISMLELGGI